MIDTKTKSTHPRVLAVIPARYGSTRFPGKPLARIKNHPMILWTLKHVQGAKLVDSVVVATDHETIFDIVIKAGGEAVMTDKNLSSGSDRAAVVASRSKADIIVNVQGDEPLLEPASIDTAIKALIQDRESSVSTLATIIHDPAILWDENIVKVLLDRYNRAIYFSRAPVPYPGKKHVEDDFLKKNRYLRHIGLYAYRRDFLLEFPDLPASQSETIEQLEQLRILDNGNKIAIAITDDPGPAVDTPEDLQMVQEFVKKHNISYEDNLNRNGETG